MKKCRLHVGVSLAVVAIAVAASDSTASAQQASPASAPRILSSAPADPYTYGTASSIVYNLVPEDFRPWVGFGGVSMTSSQILPATNGIASVSAPLHLPNGAVVDSFEYFYWDSNTAVNPNAVFLLMDPFGHVIDEAPVNFFPNVANGEQSFLVFLQTPVTINNLTTHYSLRVNLEKDLTGFLGLRQVRVRYRLQVSPAPGTAAFADVPVGDPFHRFVEALVAAGITGGCGGGNYCPNAPVTRGQMAVFLAAALGLHWPN